MKCTLLSFVIVVIPSLPHDTTDGMCWLFDIKRLNHQCSTIMLERWHCDGSDGYGHFLCRHTHSMMDKIRECHPVPVFICLRLSQWEKSSWLLIVLLDWKDLWKQSSWEVPSLTNCFYTLLKLCRRPPADWLHLSLGAFLKQEAVAVGWLYSCQTASKWSIQWGESKLYC